MSVVWWVKQGNSRLQMQFCWCFMVTLGSCEIQYICKNSLLCTAILNQSFSMLSKLSSYATLQYVNSGIPVSVRSLVLYLIALEKAKSVVLNYRMILCQNASFLCMFDMRVEYMYSYATLKLKHLILSKCKVFKRKRYTKDE